MSFKDFYEREMAAQSATEYSPERVQYPPLSKDLEGKQLLRLESTPVQSGTSELLKQFYKACENTRKQNEVKR